MRDMIELGPVPCNEDCEQVGTQGYDPIRARAECQRYIACIRQVCGTEPEGAYLTVKSFPHDFGSYYEVVCVYDTNNETAAEYAWNLDGKTPSEWTD